MVNRTDPTAPRKLASSTDPLSPFLYILFLPTDRLLDQQRLLENPTERRLLLTKGSYVLGRQGDPVECELLHESVSRIHAELSVEETTCIAPSRDRHTARVTIRDRQSQNGTIRNGMLLSPGKPYTLRDGDVLQLGEVFLLLRYDVKTPTAKSEHAATAQWRGRSRAASDVRTTLQLASHCSGPILLLGESGSGKEVAAKVLHNLYSQVARRNGRFVPYNCAAIPETLAESMLFGHVAGAFTGAAKAKIGFFQEASGGTLFLDEIGDLSPIIQPKLLRAVDTQQVIPVKGTREETVDVRVVAATNLDLLLAAEHGGFRRELLSRLASIVVRIPPLRERLEDVLPLFSAKLVEEHRIAGDTTISAEIAAHLLFEVAPQNVRELRDFARKFFIVASSGQTPTLEAIDKLSLRGKTNQAAEDHAESEETEASADQSKSRDISELRRMPTAELLRIGELEKHNVSAMARRLRCSTRSIRRLFEERKLSLSLLREKTQPVATIESSSSDVRSHAP